MRDEIEYHVNRTSSADIAEHLLRCDGKFLSALKSRVEINEYASKIACKATRFEARSGGTLVGLLAVYCNDERTSDAYITSVSVLREWIGKGIAAQLMRRCLEHSKAMGMRQIGLEVASDNAPAIEFYEKHGFVVVGGNASSISMSRNLSSEEIA